MASTSTASTDREALITGDAVLLDLRTASLAVRMIRFSPASLSLSSWLYRVKKSHSQRRIPSRLS